MELGDPVDVTACGDINGLHASSDSEMSGHTLCLVIWFVAFA